MAIGLYIICIIILFAGTWSIYGSDAAFFVFFACIMTTAVVLTAKGSKQ